MKRALCLGVFLGVLAASVLGSGAAWGQWAVQDVSLVAGWNAVYLEVEPCPADCASQFSGLPVEVVWTFDQRFAPIQELVDPGTLAPPNERWRYYAPAGQAFAVLSDLSKLEANRAYLIKASSAAAWHVTGRPKVAPALWLANSWNLTGFPVDPAAPPTFETYFAGQDAHVGQALAQVLPSGAVQTIPATTTMQRGKAYWAYCLGESTYGGPWTLSIIEGYGLNFGRTSAETRVEVNRGGGTGTISVTARHVASAPPPSGAAPLAGTAPLNFFDITSPGTWVNDTTTIAVDTTGFDLPVGVRRTEFAAYSGTEEAPVYGSLLEVKGGGCLRLAAVEAQGLPTAARLCGLWVGEVTLDTVSRAHHPTDTGTMEPTPAVMEFPIIIHVDSAGVVKLLSEVTKMWHPGVYNADRSQVLEPGHFVLVTPDWPDGTPLPEPSTLRGDKGFCRRVSSAMFAPSDTPGAKDRTMTGSFVLDGSVGAQIVMTPEDRLNPYRHQYHPDHDDASEVPGITRVLTLKLDPAKPTDIEQPGWGDTWVTGEYDESITGIHKNVIHVSGKVTFRRASLVAELNSID